MRESNVLDIFDKKPIDGKSTKPFARLPPVFECLIVFDVGYHSGNTQELIALDHAENEINFRLKTLFFK